MLPIGPLMMEHRLIERMVDVVREGVRRARAEGAIDSRFVDAVIDFIRVYADRLHHGKEEGILFRKLAGRNLGAEDARQMAELIDEHLQARRQVDAVRAALPRYRHGDADSLEAVLKPLETLAELYPEHIHKEDQAFFPAAMRYLNRDEKDAMIAEMKAFDQGLIHEIYAGVVDAASAAGRAAASPRSAGD
ncbi:MAG: hemerythrin domain-containing protein [Candidatus Eisenbacteria bacterium]